MATTRISRIETRAQREAGRRLARKAKAARQRNTLPAEVQTVAERMLALRPGQAEFWQEYIQTGGNDSWEGYIPSTGNIPATARHGFAHGS